MKIIQLACSVNPKIGGKERFTGELTKELIKMDHEVTLITCDREYEANIDCEIRYIHALDLPGFPLIPSYKDLIKQLDIKCDVCHLHYHAIFGEIVALACKILGFPVIITIHDEMKRGVHKIVYDRLLLTMISHLSDKIICLSNGMEKVLVKRGLKKEKIVVIPNAMHIENFKKEAQKIKQSINCNKNFDLLFVGRLEERKGLQYLLQALKLLNEKDFKPKLKIVGDGVYKQKLMSYVKENGLSLQVDFTGYISREELIKNYINAKCVVIPSLFEGVPTVALEAMAVGKPLIVSDIPGLNELVVNRVNGLVVDPTDINELALAIEIVLTTSKYVKSLNDFNDSILTKYDWEVVTQRIIDAYQEVLC